MGVDYSVCARRANDGENFLKHKAVLDACLNAGIEKLPQETAKYFGDEWVSKNLAEESLRVYINFELKHASGEAIHEVKLSDLPPDTVAVQFIASY